MAIGSGIAAQIGIAEELYVNEVQTITGTASATFTLTFEGATTTALATTDTAANIQAALIALPNIGAAGVACTGGPLGTGAVTITFGGNALTAKRDVATLIVQTGITGLTVATPTPGTGYGNYVAPTRFLEFDSEGLNLVQQYQASKSLRSGNVVQRADRQFTDRKGIAGDVSFDVVSKGFGLIFKHMMGTPVITTPSGGTLTRDHTYTIGDLWNKSLTVQVGRPDTGGTVQPFSYTGCKVTDWELSNAIDGFLSLKVTLDGKDETTAQTLGAASYAASAELLNFTGGQIQIAGGNVDVNKFTLKGKTGLETGRYFLRSSSLKKEPIRINMVDITGEVDLEFNSLTDYNRFVNATATNAVQMIATWTGSLIEGALNYQMKATLPAVRFDGDTPNITDGGLVKLQMKFTALYDGTNEPVTLVYRTTDTTD